MKFLFGALLVVILVCGVTASRAIGQSFNPYVPDGYTYPNAREKRAQRERAVAFLGPSARAFVERYGDYACAVIFRCNRTTGLKICEFHDSGELDKIANSVELLRVSCLPENGDDVILWAMQPEHAQKLVDPDHCQAFLNDSLSFALNLRNLTQAAAECRAARLAAQSRQQPLLSWLNLHLDRDTESKIIVVGVSALLVVLFLYLRRRQRSGSRVVGPQYRIS